MKRKLFACFLALTMLTVLTACGGKAANSSASASADTSEAMVPDYTENDSYASYTGSDSGSGGFDETESLPTDAAEQKIIYTGDLNLETTDFDAATRSLSALAEELGGYVENSSIGSSIEDSLAVVAEIIIVEFEAQRNGLHLHPACFACACEERIAHLQPLGRTQAGSDIFVIKFQDTVGR